MNGQAFGTDWGSFASGRYRWLQASGGSKRFSKIRALSGGAEGGTHVFHHLLPETGDHDSGAGVEQTWDLGLAPSLGNRFSDSVIGHRQVRGVGGKPWHGGVTVRELRLLLQSAISAAGGIKG
eukprot:superscaffoldBa00003034_g15940